MQYFHFQQSLLSTTPAQGNKTAGLLTPGLSEYISIKCHPMYPRFHFWKFMPFLCFVTGVVEAWTVTASVICCSPLCLPSGRQVSPIIQVSWPKIHFYLKSAKKLLYLSLVLARMCKLANTVADKTWESLPSSSTLPVGILLKYSAIYKD